MKEKADNTYPFIQNKDFNGTTINMDTDFFIPISVAEKFPNIVLDRPSLLISISGRIGNVGFYSCVHKAFIGGAVGICKLKYNDDGKFIIHELESEYGQKYFHLLIKASSHANITVEDIRNMELIFPNKKEEKVCISTFFSTLDHLITLHQSKSFAHIFKTIDNSTLYWEQRKFVELFLEKRDKTQSEDEDVLLSCAITGIYLNSELFSHFRGTSNIGYLKIKKNDLILSAQNLHLGNANVNLLFEHGIISPAYKVYELNECDQYFVQSWVKKDSTKDFFLNATTEGASQCRKNIDWLILNNQLIVIPSLYEQFRIGKLFNSLDRLITLHQSKLEKLQKIKKSMLESMFV